MNNESKDLPNRFPGESNENSTISTPQQNRQGVLAGEELKTRTRKRERNKRWNKNDGLS